jgi:hypothetical protein
MNAGSSFAAAGSYQPGGLRRFLRWPLDKIDRALRFRPQVRTPAKPTMVHPLEKLTFHDGAVFEIYQGQPGRPYMSLPEVQVVNKLSLKEIDDRLCEYRFELNVAADVLWQRFFSKVSSPHFVQFAGKNMILTCAPANLEASYQRIKECISWANFWYAKEREQLIAQVLAQDEAHRSAAEMNENRRNGLRRQFEFLPL